VTQARPRVTPPSWARPPRSIHPRRAGNNPREGTTYGLSLRLTYISCPAPKSAKRRRRVHEANVAPPLPPQRRTAAGLGPPIQTGDRLPRSGQVEYRARWREKRRRRTRLCPRTQSAGMRFEPFIQANVLALAIPRPKSRGGGEVPYRGTRAKDRGSTRPEPEMVEQRNLLGDARQAGASGRSITARPTSTRFVACANRYMGRCPLPVGTESTGP